MPDDPVAATEAPAAVEEREVRVSDPQLSDSANESLTEQVQEVVGTDRVSVSRDQPHPSRGDRTPADGRPSPGTSTHFILAVMVLMFLVVGAMLTALTGSWWFGGLALIAAVAGGGTVIAMVHRMTGTREHADSATVAMLEEEGVGNPDEFFSELVAEFTEAHRDDATATDGRATAVEDDPLKAGAEQAASGTPSGGSSRPVGPGSGN